jgi:pimeloyl-ACP methyl ester carboxylesterase
MPAFRGRRWLKIALAAIALYAALSFAGAWLITHPPAGAPPSSIPHPFGSTREAGIVDLAPARSGEPQLAAWWLPVRSGRGAVLLLHGYRESRAQMAGLARRIAEDTPHAVLVPDFRGCGESESRPETAGIREMEDVRTALAWLRAEGHDPARVVAVGFSMGAMAALRASATEDADELAGLLLLSPYASLEEAIDARTRHYTLVPARPIFVPMLWFAEAIAGPLLDVDLIAEAGRARTRTCLVLAQEQDWRAPLEGARRIAAGLRAPIEVFPGADHRILEIQGALDRCVEFVREALG